MNQAFAGQTTAEVEPEVDATWQQRRDRPVAARAYEDQTPEITIELDQPRSWDDAPDQA